MFEVRKWLTRNTDAVDRVPRIPAGIREGLGRAGSPAAVLSLHDASAAQLHTPLKRRTPRRFCNLETP